MANAQFMIRDGNGVVTLDLSKRITRLLVSHDRTTNPSALMQPELIKVGEKYERDRVWVMTRFSKTVRYNNQNVEGGCFPAFAVYIIDKAELQNSVFSASFKNPILASMDDTSLYVMVVDTRGFASNGYQSSVTIEVGRY